MEHLPGARLCTTASELQTLQGPSHKGSCRACAGTRKPGATESSQVRKGVSSGETACANADVRESVLALETPRSPGHGGEGGRAACKASSRLSTQTLVRSVDIPTRVS